MIGEIPAARKRFGTYEVIDFFVVLIGYALSGERTLAAYYERVSPFASQFMALFGRNHFPHRSSLSRFLSALDEASVEALRSVFLQDALARPGSSKEGGGLWDRQGNRWSVFDLDGTRQTARQRAVPASVLIYHLRRDVCMSSVHLATQDANAERAGVLACLAGRGSPVPVGTIHRTDRAGDGARCDKQFGPRYPLHNLFAPRGERATGGSQ